MQTTPPAHEARISVQPGFAWDAQDAYIFDIDGTLMRSQDRIHFNSFAVAIRQVMGLEISFAGVPLAGSTDTAILRDGFELAGIPPETYTPHLDRILQCMRDEVANRRAELDMAVMPGVEDTLRHLAGRGAVLGVGTGNLEAIGWIKIEVAGLRHWFRFGGFSDRFVNRAHLIGDAAAQAQRLAGSQARICVVGDTPRDIDAAHANGLPALAVATGHYSFEELEQHRPAVCASTLADLLAHNGSAM